MAGWQAIALRQARQVSQLMRLDEDAWPPATLDVRAGYTALRERDDLSGAIAYLAHALSRADAVAWAAHLLEADARAHPLPFRDRLALDTALRWVGEPTDAHRRAAYEAARAAGARSPERCLGFAVFATGGSIAAPGLPPVQPPPTATPRYVAGAITQGGHRGGTPERFFTRALRLGEAVAERGAAALAGVAA